ncbi:MAG: NAD-dependent epimerase/dehydratase family protein [Polyangiales bacterium]
MTDGWIIGAGYVGSALAEALRAMGRRPLEVRRHTAPPAGAAAHGRAVAAADALDPTSLRALPGTPIEYLCFCIPASTVPPGQPDPYVDGLRNCLAELDRRGATTTRVLLTSSTGVYEVGDGSWVDEETPTPGTAPRAARLHAAEALVRGRGASGVIARLSGIYGPGRTSLVEKVRDGSARTPRATRYTNRIHRDDAAGALAHLVALAAPEPRYIVTDDEPAELGEVLRWIASELHRPVPPPEDAPGTGTPRYRAEGNKRCRNAKLRGSGYTLRYPTYREGYAALLAGSAP